MRTLINTDQVLERCGGMSRSWLGDAMTASEHPFPQPVIRARGRGAHIWDASDVDAWIEARIAREANAAPRKKPPLRKGAEAHAPARSVS